ncbi:MAG: MFS transporter [Thermoplasmata archaeon]
MNEDGGKKSDKWEYSFFPNAAASGVTSPVIPLFITDTLGGTVAQVGTAVSLSSLASIPAYVLWGELSDRWKHRKFFIILGFLGVAVSLFLMSRANTIEAFILLVMFLGFIGAASAPVSNILVMESSDKKVWPEKIGALNKINGFGHVAGLVLGTIWLGYIAILFDPKESLRFLILICSASAFLAVILALILIKEPKTKTERKYHEEADKEGRTLTERARYSPPLLHHLPGIRNLKYLRERHGVHIGHELVTYLVAVLIFFIGFTIFYAPFPIFLKQVLGASDTEIFLIYIANSAMGAMMYVKAGKLAERFGTKKLQMGAVGARMVIFPVVAFVGYFLVMGYTGRAVPFLSNRELAILAVGILNTLSAFCWAIITICGVTATSHLAPETAEGEALGAYNAVTGIGSVCGAFIGGAVAYMFDYKIAFLCAAVFLMIGLIAMRNLDLNGSTDRTPG